MNKALLLFFLLLQMFTYVHAQDHDLESEEESFRNELGLNVTNVLTSLVGNNPNDDFDVAVYALTYKRKLKKGNYLRLAANVRLDIFSNEDVTELINNNSINFRIGWEKRRQVLKRLDYYYGFDLLANYTAIESTFATPTDIVQLDNFQYTIGVGPVFGLQFMINPRMLLGTEATLYGTLTVDRIFESFEQNPIFNKDETSFQINLQSRIPQALYFIVSF